VGRRTLEAIRDPWASDDGYTPPLPTPARRPRSAWYLGAALIAAILVVGIWSVTRSSGHLQGGDPGGRILAQITLVAGATPDGVKVNYPRQLSEPHVDSCDGIASTRGWSLAVVQVNFDWNRSPQEVISLVDRKMQAIGWTRGVSAEENFLPAQQWDKQLSEGKTAHTHLVAEPGGKSWTLITFAQPEGKQASGC
jgi:hypothetical protein